MFIDVHCHLDGESYGDLDGLVAKFCEAGVLKVITVGFDVASSLLAKSYAEKFPSVYFAAGIHPTETGKCGKGDLDVIADLCSHPKCVALGEIGLDYHYPDTQKELQAEYFLRQLEIAEKLSIPVQIHSRDCAEDMLRIIKGNAGRLKAGALLHCYSHSVEIAEELCKAGLYFSFGGASTWNGSKKAKRCIAALPVERLLTETDSPYMPPASQYGKFPNTSLSIPEIAQNIAEIKGMEYGEYERAAWDNAHRLFKKLNSGV